MKLFIGSHGPHIYHVEFDPVNVTLQYATHTSVGSEPTWLVANKDETLLYVSGESSTDSEAGKYKKTSGAVAVFGINSNNDQEQLTRLQTTISGGHCRPSHLQLDEEERMVYAANYFSGIFSTFKVVRPAGSQFSILVSEQTIDLNEPSKLELGPNKDRQEAAHAHWFGSDMLSAGKFIYGIDLGQDKIFQFLREGSLLRPNQVPFVRTRPGAGPRHMAFHPVQPWAYVLNELDSTLGVHTQDLATGHLGEERQFVCTIPAGTTEYSRASAITLDQKGRFVYVTNRDGSNTIVVYKILPDGLVEHVQTIESNGIHPRHIALSPDEKWLSCANQNSSRIDMFARDDETGTLEWKVGLGDLNLAVFTYFVRKF